MQKITDFYSIEGIDPTKPLDMKDPVAVMKEVRRRRKATEQAVQKQMSGSASGLSADTLEAFRTWNELFDIETHGARLTIGLGMDYMKGKKPLRVAPQYNAMSVAIFVNRYCEIAWMVHRLLPLVQPPEAMLSAGWGERWRLVDESLRRLVSALSDESGKKIGAAMVELVEKKFPFGPEDHFPL